MERVCWGGDGSGKNVNRDGVGEDCLPDADRLQTSRVDSAGSNDDSNARERASCQVLAEGLSAWTNAFMVQMYCGEEEGSCAPAQQWNCGQARATLGTLS